MIEHRAYFVSIPLVDDVLQVVKDEDGTRGDQKVSKIVRFYVGDEKLPEFGNMSVLDLHIHLLPPCSSMEDSTKIVQSVAARKMMSERWDFVMAYFLPLLRTYETLPEFDRDDDRLLCFKDYAGLRLENPLMDRVSYSYRVVLHFYGWRLHDEETGEVDRSFDWKVRYEELETQTDIRTGWSMYSFVTRIVRFLMEMKLQHFALRFVEFLVSEFGSGRLLFLRDAWSQSWFPMIESSNEMDPDDVSRVRRHYVKLDESDSD